jgi:hypothetical protein
MLENDLRAMFEWQASADQPPAEISFPVPRGRAQVRQRWRRAVTIGSPLAAAGAAVAIGLSLTLVSGVARTQSGPGWQVSSQRFNPLIPYAAFGWLPAGEQVNGGRAMPTLLYLDAGQGGSLNLVVYPPGQCSLSATRLTCGSESNLTDAAMAVTGPAPVVNGRLAYWGRELPADLTEPYLRNEAGRPRGVRVPLPMLAFQYRQGGWALLIYPDRAIHSTLAGMVYPDQATVTKIAEHVRFGQTTPISFAARLTGLPRQWRIVERVAFERDGRLMQGFMLYLGPPTGTEFEPESLFLGLGEGGGRTMCQRGVSCRMIDGSLVALSQFGGMTASGPPVPVYGLIAANADDLLVNLLVTGPHPPLSPAEIFAHHLQLLGPDRANWTTKPISP